MAFALQDDGADVAAVRAIERVQSELVDEYDDEPIPDRVMNVLERLDREWRDAKRDSWFLRSAIVWAKPNPMPESVTDRPTSAYEMVFLLTKQPRYFYDAEAVRVPHAPSSIARYEYGLNATIVDDKRISAASTTGAFQSERMGDHVSPSGANLRNVWDIPTQGRPDAHFATFPDELPRRCILAGTSEHGVCADCGAPWVREFEKSESPHDGNTASTYPEGSNAKRLSLRRQAFRERGIPDEISEQTTTLGFQPTCDHDAARIPATVLDPFVGSGTTVAVAQTLGRKGIGLDLNAEYLEIAKRTIGRVTLPLPM